MIVKLAWGIAAVACAGCRHTKTMETQRPEGSSWKHLFFVGYKQTTTSE